MTRTNPREGKTWPGYILGGRLRTSTLVLVIAFIAIGWVYNNWEAPTSVPQQVPASEVVPPGYIPDPNYTWAPRTDVQRHLPTSVSMPTTTTETTASPTTSATTAESTTASSTASSSVAGTPVTPSPSTTPSASTDAVTPSPSSSVTMPPSTHSTAHSATASSSPTPAPASP